MGRFARSLVVATLVAMSSCGDSPESTQSVPAPERTPEVTLTFSLTGCAYDGPSLADQGDVDFAVVNQVGEDMHVDIWTMDEGYTFEEFSTYVDEERERLESGIQPLGPPDAVTMLSTIEVARGATGTETLGVSEGTIGFACIAFDGEQGTMHAAGPLEVTS